MCVDGCFASVCLLRMFVPGAQGGLGQEEQKGDSLEVQLYKFTTRVLGILGSLGQQTVSLSTAISSAPSLSSLM